MGQGVLSLCVESQRDTMHTSSFRQCSLGETLEKHLELEYAKFLAMTELLPCDYDF